MSLAPFYVLSNKSSRPFLRLFTCFTCFLRDENDVTKVSGEMVIQLAQILGVSADEILGLAKLARTTTAIKNRRIYRQLQSIDKLPKRDQEALARTIDAFLSKAS